MYTTSQLRAVGLFDARVPRYTSYPPANHFGTAVGPVDMARWVAAIPERAEISLYIHVPFCRRLCWFCACRTQGTLTDGPLEAYVKVLCDELALLARHLPRGVRLKRLHWGGGTPTLLPPATIAALATRIGDLAEFAEGYEFSVEIDPNEIDEARIDVLVDAGMNRASIGVQDFDPRIQDAIGRHQSFDLTRRTTDALRERGIPSLNMDLLYGLPHQTVDGIAQSVQKVLSLSPDRVALYGYAHVPWMARRQTMIPAEALPTPEVRMDLFERARQLFLWDGYSEIGIDHFALPGDGLARAADEGRLRRNFQGYTDDTAPVLIGLGASAISRFPEGYAQNDPRTSGYHKAVEAGGFATVRGHVFSDEDRIRGAMIEAMMCAGRIDFAGVAGATGADPAEIAARAGAVHDAFPDAVTLTEDGLTLEPEARPLIRLLAQRLDAYVTEAGRHSPAI